MEEEAIESPSPPQSPVHLKFVMSQSDVDETIDPILPPIPAVPEEIPTTISEVPVKKKYVDHDCAICHGEILKDYEDEDDKTGKDMGWIQCDACRGWSHQICADVEEYQTELFDVYHCSDCVKIHGPTLMKYIKCPHRYRFDREDELEMPIQVGTKAWISRFIEIEADFPAITTECMPIYEDGTEFMNNFDWNAIWTNPVKILKSDGLGMKLPDRDFGIENIEQLVDPEESIDTIDVYIQQSVKMKLKTFVNKWKDERDRLYNMISFEFSHTKLMDIVTAPRLMYKLSWVHKIWHNEDGDLDFNDILFDEHVSLRPDVALFCLLGMGGSYTDFHIDFGGSSVWYHVFKGQKIFYVIPPEKRFLHAFLNWSKSKQKAEKFFGDVANNLCNTPKMFRVVINEGETVMLPSGWIHAVYTPVDSIVFGGNFVHSLNMAMQLRVYEIELDAKYETNFMFPHFELTNWYAAIALTTFLRACNDGDRTFEAYLIPGLKAMLASLTKWIERDNTGAKYAVKDFRRAHKELREELSRYTKSDSKSKSPPPRRRTIARNSSGSKIMNMLEDAKAQMALEDGEAITVGDAMSLGLKLKLPKLEFTNGSSPSPLKEGKDDKKRRKAEEKANKLSKKERGQLANILSRPEGTGRKIKPAAWVNNNVVMDTHVEEQETTPSKNFNAQFSKEEQERLQKVEEIANRECAMFGDNPYSSPDDDDFILDKQTKKRKKKPEGSVMKEGRKPKAEDSEKEPPKKKKSPKSKIQTTAKQRLAKKLGIKY